MQMDGGAGAIRQVALSAADAPRQWKVYAGYKCIGSDPTTGGYQGPANAADGKEDVTRSLDGREWMYRKGGLWQASERKEGMRMMTESEISMVQTWNHGGDRSRRYMLFSGFSPFNSKQETSFL